MIFRCLQQVYFHNKTGFIQNHLIDGETKIMLPLKLENLLIWMNLCILKTVDNLIVLDSLDDFAN